GDLRGGAAVDTPAPRSPPDPTAGAGRRGLHLPAPLHRPPLPRSAALRLPRGGIQPSHRPGGEPAPDPREPGGRRDRGEPPPRVGPGSPDAGAGLPGGGGSGGGDVDGPGSPPQRPPPPAPTVHGDHAETLRPRPLSPAPA